MWWDSLKEWFLSLGAEYGVDPIIFGSISIGAIPFFWLSVAWLVRNLRSGKPIFLPVLATSLCVLSAYIYLFIAGENLPVWVYAFVAALIGYSAYSTVTTVRKQTTDGAAGSAASSALGSSSPAPANPAPATPTDADTA